MLPMVGFAKVFAHGARELDKMSQRTGISVETLSELRYAAQVTGVDIETLEIGIKRMQRALAQAAMGSESAVDTLGQLGLTVADFRGLSPDQQLKLLADRLAQVRSPALRAALAMELFGRSGTQLFPLIGKGAAGIAALQEQARKLGLTASREGVKAGVELEEALTTLWAVLKKLGSTIGAAVAPALTQFAKWLTDLIVRGIAWIKQNKALVLYVFKVAAVVNLAGLALVGLGYAISAVGTVIVGFGKVVALVSTVVQVLGGVISWLTSPIGLVVAALAALTAYILYATGAGAKALSWLAQRFSELKSDAIAAYQGIADALAAGDIGLAAKILWLTLKMEWLKGVKWLQSLWLSFKHFFIKVAYDAFYGMQAVWEIVGNALLVSWIELKAFAAQTWTSIAAGFKQAWGSAIGWTERRLHELYGLMDESYDVEGAKRISEERVSDENAQIENEKRQALTALEKQRKLDRQGAARYHDQEMARIGQESIDAEKELDDEYAAKMKAAQDEIDKARQEWLDAIAEAKRKRLAKEAQGPDKLTPPEELLDNLGDLLGQGIQRTIGVMGTFNAMEAPGLASGGVADRLAKASEETAKNTKRLVQLAEDGGLEFE
jgi:hypothetical protein